MKKKVFVYISGKIGNGKMPTPEQLEAAKPKFKAVADELSRMGYDPINPLSFGFTNKMKYDDVLDICLSVLSKKANAIFMLNDWRESNGARKEMQEAQKNGLPIYFEESDDLRYMQDYADNFWCIKTTEGATCQ